MAELILGSVVESLTGHVLSFLSNEIGQTYSVKLELEKFQSTLSIIRGVLQDAEKRQVNDQPLKEWLKELKDLAYEADDLLDDFNTEFIRRKSVVGGCKKVVSEVSMFFSSNQLIYANRMAHLIKGLNGKIDAHIKNSESFKLKSISENPSLKELHHNRPLTVSSDYERYVVGRDEDKKHVINFLLDPNFEENLSILSIVGFGGMGKTTLARLVFKDEQLKDYFEKKLWVCVSTNFVAENILRNILQECVGESRKDEIADLQKNGLHDKLRAELGEKKFLLVLDDVWNEDGIKWLELQNHLPYGTKGSKMLVTTRSSLVANTMAKTSRKLSGLSEEESLTLLMKMAGKEEDEWKNKNLEGIAKEILKKCGGVPLAIMTIGRLLSTRFSEREWSGLLEEDFSRIEQSDGDIMPTLKISYDFLPSHLKECFTYCCLFPKDYELDPNELVRLWMAQGFISPRSNKTLHDVGKEYFKELVWRSFFQDIKKDGAGNITGCKMHDLMHDLARKVAGGSYTTIINSSSTSGEGIPKEVRHVSMVVDMSDRRRGSYNLKSLGPNQRIRSLLSINHYYWQEKTLSGDISSFRNLRALGLHSLGIKNVPRSIRKLRHLRSLDLSWSRELTSLPNSIGKLLNLETLILYGCKKLESLPRDVTKLVNLRHLNTEGCGSLTHMPRGMGNLINLEVLRGFRVEEREKWNAARMNELIKLTGLEELSIEYLGGVKKELDSMADFWIDKNRLQRLHLSWGFNVDHPREYAEEVFERRKPNLDLLKSFTINHYPGTTLASWTGELHNLVEIEIAGCDHIKSIPPLDQLYSLESIKLSHCNNIGSIPPLDQLPSLKSISLDGLPLKWIELAENSIGLYPSLERVSLHLRVFKGWKRMTMDVNRSRDQTIHSSSPFFIPSFSRKVDVRIDGCRMLCCTWNDNKRLRLAGMKYKDLEELWRKNVEEEVEVVECSQKVSSSSPTPTQMGSSLRLLPLSSVPLHMLTSLELANLDIEHLPMELFQSLSRLQYLNIKQCFHMKSIPPLDQLSSLESISLSVFKYIRSIPPLDQLPSLKSISLEWLQELEWIEMTENSICLYLSLERVCLYGLPMFKGWKRMRMDVNRSGDQTIHSSSPFFISSFSRKVDVRIDDCGMLCCTWNGDGGVWLQVGGMKYKDLEEELWRRNRKNVEEEEEEVMVTQMGSLTFVPLSSIPLHTLASLSLHHLEDTEELPSELFRSLSRLQSFEIFYCHRLKSLSLSVILRYLVSLESLVIAHCHWPPIDVEEDNKAIQGIANSQTKIKKLVLGGMDKMKTLPPWIQYLPKLETLILKDCENMETLPVWFSQLTSLKRLEVIRCGELSRRCLSGECMPQISHIKNRSLQR